MESRNHRIIKVGKELQDHQVQPQSTPPCPLTMSLNVTYPRFLNTSRGGDSSWADCANASLLFLRANFSYNPVWLSWFCNFAIGIPHHNIQPLPLILSLVIFNFSDILSLIFTSVRNYSFSCILKVICFSLRHREN